MTRIEYIKKKRRIADNSMITFLSALNNTVFTTKFFQLLSNQTYEVKNIITIPDSTFFDFTHKNGLDKLDKQTLYVGRKRNGEILGSIYITENNKDLLNYQNISRKIPIIQQEARSHYKSIASK